MSFKSCLGFLSFFHRARDVFCLSSSLSSTISGFPKITTVPLTMAGNPPAAPTRYAPLVLPTILHDLPSKYTARIKTWGSDEDITTNDNVDQCNAFIDREEVDHEDVKLRLFAQSFTGEVGKWFKALTIGSIQ